MIGVNGGNQLNILVFEVGMIQTVDLAGIETQVVSTVSIHPLLVAPTSIRYSDATRSSYNQTGTSVVLSPGGRGLRTVTLEGTFGVESRGLGPYIGNGAIRYQRFYKEVVRMGEALTQNEVDDNVDWLNGTPFIKLLVSGYNEESTNFFVNFYDFWHDRSFQCLVMSFETSRSFDKGGASGLTHYTMVLREVGPIVAGGFGASLVSALMDGLTLWNDINNVISSYNLATIVDAFVGPVAIAAGQLEGTLQAVQDQLDAITDLFGTGPTPSLAREAYVSFLGSCADLASSADNVAALITTSTPDPTGSMDWNSPSADTVNWDYARGLRELADAARFQGIAGIFFGMSPDEYQGFVGSSGDSSWRGPEFGGSVVHVVSTSDTPERLERLYGVSWGRILRLNALTPLEALVTGVELKIPVQRYYGSQGSNSIPVLGSHTGTSAYGSDLAMEIDVDADGDLLVVEGLDCLSQGIQTAAEDLAAGLLDPIQSIPENARDKWLTSKIGRSLLSDPRISSVSSVVAQTSDRGITLDVTAVAINGDPIRTGARI